MGPPYGHHDRRRGARVGLKAGGSAWQRGLETPLQTRVAVCFVMFDPSFRRI